MADFTLDNLRGGMNDADPPSALPADQCVLAQNVEFNDSMIGERRKGCTPIDISGSDLADHDQVVFLFRHLPNDDETDAQLWALGFTSGDSVDLAYKDTAWHTVVPADAISITEPDIYDLAAVSFRNKMPLCYPSSGDRMHVWDGTDLRRMGLAEPANAPTGANAGSGTLVGTRYYRVRWTRQSGGSTILRSEPSAVLTFSPSGSGASVTVTRPTTTGEDPGITHWELEASTALNGDYYRVATTAIGTSTASDSTDYVAGYASAGFTLSADIGDYTVIPAMDFVVVDEDRLVFANKSGLVLWTPVASDPTGDGNDERYEHDQDAFKNLDSGQGGELTGFIGPVNGYIFAFKRSTIYKLVRTGQRAKAYDAICLTRERGALPGSVVQGVDQNGAPCLYFTDPNVGGCRISERGGIQQCGRDLETTWLRVNVNAATVVSRSVYYPDTKQVHWWLAADDEDTPSLRISCRPTSSVRPRMAMYAAVGRFTKVDRHSRSLRACSARTSTTTPIDLMCFGRLSRWSAISPLPG
jgi:hypothetical protein